MQTVARAPVTTALRDWLRDQDTVAGLLGDDTGLDQPPVYAMHAAGAIPPARTELPALTLARVGGGDDGVALDHPLIQFDIWGPQGSGHDVETIAAALVELLHNTRPGTVLAAGLHFMGAVVESSFGSPYEGDGPRFIVTASLTTRAV
jgi:hypothetical protein